ncbi:MAG: FG-GAP repeat protein, partial [Spirochaetes bacterium]|nr:FG-GAP repeat protein [Spirochaetota bacterium]
VAYARVNRVDETAPVVSITDPSSDTSVFNNSYTVKGTARDETELEGVYISINGSEYARLANTEIFSSGTVNWSAAVGLVPGVNTIRVYSKDFGGNISSIKTVKVTYNTVEIKNLRDKCVVNTGFVIGTVANGASVAQVQVKLDNGVYTPAQGTANWKYKLPTGSSSWRHGTRHTVSVRSRDIYGVYSPITTISVRKGNNKDVNGDGYADMAVGCSKITDNQSWAYIFHGSATGISSGNASSANTIISGSAYFGKSVSLGDVNGDGYADLAVSGNTTTYIFHGGPSGIANCSAGSANTVLNGSANIGFGNSIATGDVNGDGYDDLAIGAPDYSNDTGRTFIYHGSAYGIQSSIARTITGESSSEFGCSLCFGDIDADGYSDLIVGATKYNNSDGRVYIFYGKPGGIDKDSAGSAKTILTGIDDECAECYNHLGRSIATGDINGDGYTDIAIGKSGYRHINLVCFFYGKSSGITSGTSSTADIKLLGFNSYSSFGHSIAMGDINGDGYDDIAVGTMAFRHAVREKAYIFYSGISGFENSESPIVIIRDSLSLFGNAFSIGDINGDGYADLLIGAKGLVTLNYQGYVYLFHGRLDGITSCNASSAETTIAGEEDSHFGSSLDM